MKIPVKPPDWQEYFAESQGNVVDELIFIEPVPMMVSGRYVHWDKLRHLTPPGRLTHKKWWAEIKRTRNNLYKTIPLRSVQNELAKLVIPDEALEQLHRLDRDTGSQILVSENVLNGDERRRYVVSSLMEEAITSSQIEGAATTRQVAKELLLSGRAPLDKSERMILNNYQAMQRISEISKHPLTPEVVFELHRILGRDALDVADAAGRLRRSDENIAVYSGEPGGDILHHPPPASELPRRLQQMCDFANAPKEGPFIHPVVRAIILHFWLAYDHPFADGNGRCARALFYWSMLHSDYWLTEFLSISSVIRKAPVRYGRAFLYVETDDFDLTYFVLYHLDLIHKAVSDLRGHLKRKMQEVKQTEQLLRSSGNFNHRQLALLSHALRHSDATYTIDRHRSSHDVVYQTARLDLLNLVDRGLLKKMQKGKEFIFFVAPDLPKRMGVKQERKG